MQAKKRFWGIVGLCVGLMVGFMSSRNSQAAVSGPQNNIGFSVSASLPSNQLDQKNSYFDLKLESGQKQTLKATVSNLTNRDIKVKTSIHTAYTNHNGAVEYITPTKQFDSSLKYQLAQLTQIKGDKLITVPANGSKIVEAVAHIPETAFQGVMLGGWNFEKVEEKVTSNVKGAMNVRNQYAYMIAMKYTLGKVPAPRLVLSKVEPGLENGRQSIFPYIRNVTATIVPGLILDTKISNRETGKVIKTVQKSGVKLAPNSVFKYPILTGKEQLKAGKYHLRMIAKNKDHRWVFEKDFEITAAAAKKYNQASIENKQLKPIWLVAFGAFGMLVLGSLIIWLILFVKKRKSHL